MTAYILRRLLATIPVMVVVAVFVFFLLRLAPGDPAAIIAGEDATAEQIAAVHHKLGLDRPIFEQFVVWIAGMLQGDFGTSIFSNLPVSRLILQRLEPTVSLTLSTLLVAVCLAIPLGVLAAWKARRLVDRLVMGFAVMGFAMPVFLVGYVLIYLFAMKLHWLPVQGYRRLFGASSQGVGAWAYQLVLPWFTLATIYVALIARVTRASVSEALTEDYIRTARAKGITESAVLLRHALANAAVPIATVIGIGVALLIGGVVVTETVFAIPGLGSLTVDAVLNRDFPVIQGVVLFFSVLYVLVNLAVDLSYLFLDPRIRY